ncbi:hypothetical protein WMY93_021285 [Mugilogobius chulae]|uniref:Centrosomal protein of 83 kDa n=1 Tax=Mugilogobius chulae TaxID=88201 RepID=A0AAW0NDE6_9GOBI
MEASMGRSAAMLGLSASLGGPEMELQKMLIDERMKSESHRTNYQTLKAEHTSLQDEFTRAQNELRRLLSERQTQQERQQLLLAELRGELLDKTRELEDLRLQIMTPQRLELLRAQVQQEMEGPIRERFDKLEEEAERYRSDYNKMRYDFTLLKSQFDHQREEHFRTLEERRIVYEAEICRLEKDREDLVAQYQGVDPLCDSKRVESLLREKAQLLTRLKGLETEVMELRAQRENSGQQAENVQRIQIRQISEAQATIKALEAERQSVRLQLERVETELKSTLEQNSDLTAKLHKAEREVNSLNCQIDNLKHSHKLELATVKLKCARSKAEVERDREALQAQIDGLQSDVEVLKASVERHKEVLVEKERQIGAGEPPCYIGTAEGATRHHCPGPNGGMGRANKERPTGRRVCQRELQSLRSKLHLQISQLDELERQKAEVAELKRQNHDLSVQLGTLSHTESVLTETNQRLRETLEKTREELRASHADAEKSQHQSERYNYMLQCNNITIHVLLL